MSISHDERDELRDLLEQAFGARGADLLMAGLAAADLEAMEERLTLRIDNVRLELRAEMAELRTELKGDGAELRGAFGELRGEFGELRGEFGELRGEFGELRGEFGELRGEFGELRGEIATQTRMIFFAVFTACAAVAGLVLAALQIVT